MTQYHLGQVAGLAAALALRRSETARTLNVKELQRELLRQGFQFAEQERLKDLGLTTMDDRR